MTSSAKSPWIIHYDASSCNGCDIETLACLTPLFDVERLGILNTGNPKHADIFVVTGAVNEQSRGVIQTIYRQMPEPKVVVAVGACASTGGIFSECYNISGGVDGVIPVDVYVPGCAARPEAIIDGVVKAVGLLELRRREFEADPADEVRYLRADKPDATRIHALQKIAFRGEGETYGEDNVPAIRQGLAELENEFDSGNVYFLKAVLHGRILGSVCVEANGATAQIGRLSVHPFFRGRSIGRQLLVEVEKLLPGVKRFEALAGQRSERTIGFLRKCGYCETRTEPVNAGFSWVYLQKDRS